VSTYAVGDIQGCMEPFQRLLDAIDPMPGRDRLWLVGDLVNRGPRSLDVLRWARAHEADAVTVLGNHDYHLLGRAAGTAQAKKRDTVDDILAAPDRDALIDWVRSRPLLHVENGFAMVHAGLHPRWTIARAQELAGEVEAVLRGPDWRRWLGTLSGPPPRWRDDLTGPRRIASILGYFLRARMLQVDGGLDDHDGPPEEAPEGRQPWFAVPDPAWGDHTIVFGHWSALGLRLGERHIAIDAGCVWGRSLAAVRLEDRAVFQVPCAAPAA